MALFDKMRDKNISGIVYPITDIVTNAKTFGFVNRFTDLDGTIRKVQLIEVFENRIYFNLAFMMLIESLDVSLKNVQVNPGKEIIIKNTYHPLSKIKEKSSGYLSISNDMDCKVSSYFF